MLLSRWEVFVAPILKQSLRADFSCLLRPDVDMCQDWIGDRGELGQRAGIEETRILEYERVLIARQRQLTRSEDQIEA